MIDQALAWKPYTRRNNQDNASERSSPKPKIERSTQQRYPSRTNNQSYPNSTDQKNSENVDVNLESTWNSRPAKVNTTKDPKTMAVEEAASPAIKDRHLKRISQRSSKQVSTTAAQQYTHESAKVLQSSVKLAEKKAEDSLYKVKLMFFMIISIFLMYQVMKPSRKAPYKKKN